MKKVLLLTAAMMTMSMAATAQEAVRFDAPKARNMKEAKAAPVASVACDVKYNAATSKATRRTIADGVSYGRPEGTYYLSGTTSAGAKFQYLYIPALVDATYKNYATDKASAKWQYGASTLTDIAGDENNDLTTSWPKIDRNYISSAYIPTLSVGDTSYQFGEELGLSQNALINGDSILEVTQVNRAGGSYYGFSDGAVFGSGDRNLSIDGATVACKRNTVYEFFSKPVAPFCLNSIVFNIVAYSGGNFIPDGTTMHLYVVKMTEDGKLTDEAIDLPFTSEDIQEPELYDGKNFGFVELSRMTEDDFGTPVLDPIIIDYPFAIVIDGFAQEGVDFSLYMTDVMATERDFCEVEGGVEATCCEYVRADTGEPVDGLYYCQYISSTGPNAAYVRQYNALIYLVGMFDIARVAEGFENMTAPVEGGAIYAEVEEENEETGSLETNRYATLQYYTTCPRLSDWEGIEGNDNYQFVDLPDWLKIEEYNDTYYEDYSVTLAKIVADPLPAGVDGRQAQIRIISDKGADTGVITITQGSVDQSGINAVQANKVATSNAAMYNLAGQRVDKNFKGFVVKDGVKFLNK